MLITAQIDLPDDALDNAAEEEARDYLAELIAAAFTDSGLDPCRVRLIVPALIVAKARRARTRSGRSFACG